ncbi:MAG: hypothetical protein LBS55_06750 [Prevotellaceae bacterium]|jgi:hypothetical protein|nr:hypothetical protein [Prevotellaceae bacterium]
MKKFSITNLDANKSNVKKEVGKISCVRHKNLKFRFLLFVLLSPIVTGSFFIACNSENNTFDLPEFEIYLSLNVSDFDFARDWDNLSELDKKTFRSAKKRMDITFDKNGICRTKWTSNRQVNISDELFDCLLI